MINPIALILSNLIPNIVFWIALIETNDTGLLLFIFASNIIVYMILLFIGIPAILMLMRFNIYDFKFMLLMGSSIGGVAFVVVMMAFGFVLQSAASVNFQWFIEGTIYGSIISSTYFFIDKIIKKIKN